MALQEHDSACVLAGFAIEVNPQYNGRESGFVHDLVIRNNTIDSLGQGIWVGGSQSTSGLPSLESLEQIQRTPCRPSACPAIPLYICSKRSLGNVRILMCIHVFLL